MKGLNLKLTDSQHANLEAIAAELGMTKTQVAIVCIDLGCKSLGGVYDLTLREYSRMAEAFGPLTEKIKGAHIDDPEIEDQED